MFQLKKLHYKGRLEQGRGGKVTNEPPHMGGDIDNILKILSRPILFLSHFLPCLINPNMGSDKHLKVYLREEINFLIDNPNH
jgi:hypothetical protein